jgi:L-alanine-DL-glutamate epimerase-like enolase superfamily enzyme
MKIVKLNLLFARPCRICPLAEWGVKINANVQYFYKDFYQPVDGYFELPPGPGFGYELDLSKAVKRIEL